MGAGADSVWPSRLPKCWRLLGNRECGSNTSEEYKQKQICWPGWGPPGYWEACDWPSGRVGLWAAQCNSVVEIFSTRLKNCKGSSYLQGWLVVGNTEENTSGPDKRPQISSGTSFLGHVCLHLVQNSEMRSIDTDFWNRDLVLRISCALWTGWLKD